MINLQNQLEPITFINAVCNILLIINMIVNLQDEYEEMFERIDREADGEVYVNEVLDFLQIISNDLEQVRF